MKVYLLEVYKNDTCNETAYEIHLKIRREKNRMSKSQLPFTQAIFACEWKYIETLFLSNVQFITSQLCDACIPLFAAIGTAY